MPKVSLQGSCISAFVGQHIASRVPEHVRVNLEGHLGFDPGSLDQLGQAGDRERSAALAHEYERRVGLALQHS